MRNLEYFKNTLLMLKEELENRMRKVNAGICHKGMTADLDDQSIEVENDEVLKALANSSEHELIMVDEALARIDSGDYFSCRSCGAPIPTARLELLPFTSQCVACAGKHQG
jgi:DnaK suppressor protein